MKLLTRRSWSTASTAVLLFASSAAASMSLTGCSNVNTGGTMRESSIYMTLSRCVNECGGSAFAIVQYQSCWCSNVAPPSNGNVGDCNQKCPAWPDENCGNSEKGLYGYTKLDKNPTSTAGGGGGSSSSSSPPLLGGGGFGGSSLQQQSVQQSSQAPPPQQTVYKTQTTTNVPIASTVTNQVTSQVVSQVTSAETSVQTSVATVSLTPSASTDTYTASASVVTSAAVVTVSGAVVTSIVTSSSAPSSTAQPDARLAQQTKSGLSNGAVAGITIGSIAAAAIALLALFFCWRRRKQQQAANGDEMSMKRSGSVMSKMGLLRTGSATSAPLASSDGPRLPEIITSVSGGRGPESASTNMSEARRNSRPIFVDSRLNPNAIMLHNDHSRTSIATLQDNQDYSRPLEVRNPD